MPLIGGRWRPTRRDPYRRQILGVRKSPPAPTCIRCGAPVPAAAATCETDCKPRVVPAKDADGGQMSTPDGFQDRGEPHRRRLGIDGTAGDAQDVGHPYVADEPFGDWCVVCGLARSYRRHAAAVSTGRRDRRHR